MATEQHTSIPSSLMTQALAQTQIQGSSTPHPLLAAELVLDHMPVGMALVDAEDRLLWANDAMVNLACPSGGELCGRRLDELLWPVAHVSPESDHLRSPGLGEQWQQAWLSVDDSNRMRPGQVCCVPFQRWRDVGVLTFVDFDAEAELCQRQRVSESGNMISRRALEDCLAHAARRFPAPNPDGSGDGCLHQWREARQALRYGLQEALTEPDRHFHLVYQPQLELDSGECTGLEAMVRWRHSQYGMIEPRALVEIPEEGYLIDRMDRWAMQAVVEQHRRWRDQAHPLGEARIAINIHPRLLDRNAFDGRPLDVFLRQLGDCLDWLTLEISGTGLFEDGERHSRLLQRITALGVQVAINELGNSPTDLLTLAILPVSMGKISAETAQSLSQVPSSVRCVAALVQCLKTLRLESVAVGVETAEQLEVVRGLGLTRIQGGLIAKARDAEALERWFVRQARQAAA